MRREEEQERGHGRKVEYLVNGENLKREDQERTQQNREEEGSGQKKREDHKRGRGRRSNPEDTHRARSSSSRRQIAEGDDMKSGNILCTVCRITSNFFFLRRSFEPDCVLNLILLLL